ncbi:MAG: DUF3659 domain-containing protein [Gammaproteobacteria bacterium]|uniref:Uncharacterized protein n=1 Tax=viral metagenome TaxID=1070528 RepID=A0A6H1ZB22_9ZZZZ|nr:DUF3659 domain-containing protein [Gammaproteobacteria bacterium]
MPKSNGEDELSDYIDSVSGIEDTGAVDTSVDTGADDGAADVSDGTPAAKTGSAEDKAVEAKSGDQQQQKPKDQKAKDEQSAKDAQGAKPKFKKTPHGNLVDDKGNIVDQQGNVIAPMGRARRIYEDNEKLTREYTRVKQERDQFELQTREIALLNNVPKQYNLNNDEVARALDFAGRMKRGDTLGVAKDLLALISAQGHNISELLGEDVGDSIDMRAVKAMLDQRLGPIQQQREEDTQRTQREEEGRRNYERFVSDNEYADVHGDAIANLMKAQSLPPQVAYNRIREFAYANNFDFSEPLGPQIAERQATGSQTQQRPNDQRPAPKPLGNGRQSTRDNGVRPAQPQYADPDEDWGSIIRRAM